jgi:hypothetical protein
MYPRIPWEARSKLRGPLTSRASLPPAPAIMNIEKSHLPFFCNANEIYQTIQHHSPGFYFTFISTTLNCTVTRSAYFFLDSPRKISIYRYSAFRFPLKYPHVPKRSPVSSVKEYRTWCGRLRVIWNDVNFPL